ncbi:MAG TPA: triphosphoribosyl-dephospho-CoA synthase [Rubrobacter sp.]
MSVVVKKAARPGSPATDILVDLAVRALVEEVRLTPKPGLVDLRGPGAHDDLSLGLMLRSAESLRTTFADVARACEGARVDRGLREVLGAIGREGEAEMLAATGGANAHRGAIWTLGLLVAGAVLSVGESEGDRIAASAARIARLPDDYGVPRGTNGARVRSVHGVAGATGEARAGFPHVVGIALPALRAGRKTGRDEDTVRIDALLGIMAVLDDTCLLHRGGLRGLRLAQRGAAQVLEAGGVSVPEGKRALASLEDEMLEEWLSPGGAADLLSAAMFLDSLEQRERDGESSECRKGG